MFCSKCGNELEEGSLFCPKCGTRLTEHECPESQLTRSQENKIKRGKIRCPKCNGINLQYMTESNMSSETKGGGYSAAKGGLGYLAFGPCGLLCGNCGSKQTTTVTTTQKHFWVCSDCGNKFQSLEDLQTEIDSHKKSLSSALFYGGACILLGILILLAGMVMGSKFILLTGGILLGIGGLDLGFAVPVEKSSIEKTEKEYQEMEQKIRGND